MRADRALPSRAEFNDEHVARVDFVIRGRFGAARVVDPAASAEFGRGMAITKGEIADPLVGDRRLSLLNVDGGRTAAAQGISDLAMGDENSRDRWAWL